MGWLSRSALLLLGLATGHSGPQPPEPRRRHPKPDVERALQYAESRGWTVWTVRTKGHRWGIAACGHGCRHSIWGSPQNQGDHAKDIRHEVDRCPHHDQQRERR